MGYLLAVFLSVIGHAIVMDFVREKEALLPKPFAARALLDLLASLSPGQATDGAAG
jgi:hypothetical protein